MDEQIPSGKIPSSWPSPQDYNEAVQNPLHSFRDAELATANPELDALGLPRPYSGMFASVYQIRKSGKSWAARCFLRQTPDLIDRYTAICGALEKAKFPFAVDFELQAKGILVHGKWMPLLKMQWCAGETLERWLAEAKSNPARLQKFQNEFARIVTSMQACGIAHGDLQHGNILIDGDAIKIVDYDAMFVPELRGLQSNELGHGAYQHPGRSQSDFDERLDNFSAWLIYLSVEILKHAPELWDDFSCGNDALLFRKSDLTNPASSRMFFLLEAHELAAVKDAARKLRYLAGCSLSDLPGFGTDLLVPDDFAELLPVDQEESSRQIVVFDASPDPGSSELIAASGELVDQGPFHHNPKRPRSKVKGGVNVAQRKGTEPVASEKAPTKKSASNSALAQLFMAPSQAASAASGHELVSLEEEVPTGIASLDGSVESIKGTYYRARTKSEAVGAYKQASQVFTVLVLVLTLTFVLMQMFR